MVYKSRDYVYYTKKENPSDPAAKWMAAYPVGKGIYPDFGKANLALAIPYQTSYNISLSEEKCL